MFRARRIRAGLRQASEEEKEGERNGERTGAVDSMPSSHKLPTPCQLGHFEVVNTRGPESEDSSPSLNSPGAELSIITQKIVEASSNKKKIVASTGVIQEFRDGAAVFHNSFRDALSLSQPSKAPGSAIQNNTRTLASNAAQGNTQDMKATFKTS